MSKRPRTQNRHEHRDRTFGTRTIQVRTNSLNIDDRSIEADVSTENPVLMPDYERGEMVPEVLLTSGVILPDSRQVPFLDSHQRTSVSNQLGSARDISIGEDNRLKARLQFSSAAEAEFVKVREGHVTDVSAGYQILKKQSVKRGETKEIEGRSYEGPVNVVTQWRLMEVSLTPIGADSLAKLRGLDPDLFTPRTKGFEMLKELRDWCVARGMSVNLTDEEAQKWMSQHLSEKAESDIEDPEKKDEEDMPAKPEEGAKSLGHVDTRSINEIVAAETRKAIASEQERIRAFNAEVDTLCQLADLPNEAAACRSLPDAAAVRKHLADKKAELAKQGSLGVRIAQTGSGFENLMRDMGSALVTRAVQSATPNSKTQEAVYPVEQRSKGAANFKYASLFNMAEEYVRALGIDTRQLSREDIAIAAMFGPEKLGIRNAAYHTTGSFANLTLDAVNKSMMVGYTETPATWRGPMRQAASVPDFKQIHRIRMGAIPNLPVWNDNSNPEKASFADAKESYAVESRSLEINFSYRLLVNDDMDAISRTPAMMGAAAARTVNAVAWSQITSNPTMSDSVALFATATGARKRTNLTSGAGSPSVSTLQTLSNLMRQMRGENTPDGNESADILNLSPRYIVGPSALDTTIKQLVLSAYDPSANTFQVYNTASSLIPVIEPLLDVASTTAWYLFADPSQIDTVEVSFLQGQENPVVREFTDERNLSRNYIVMQTFAAKAMNHRGIQKHAGA